MPSGPSSAAAAFPCRLFAVAPPGLESTLRGELASIGIQTNEEEGGMEWEGGWEDLIRAHLHLWTASRILLRVGSFRARALTELERKVESLPWQHFLPRDARISCRVSAGRSRIYHEGAVEERLRRALGKLGFTGAALPAEGDGGEDPPGRGGSPGGADRVQLVVVRIFRDMATFSLDASGDHLHRRGYRVEPGAAPLRETLAAGGLLASGWEPSQALLDPFAGSGTIPIEAALLALRVPPGLASVEEGTGRRVPREFSFLRWPGAPKDRFHEEVERARTRILPEPPAPILATDRDGLAVRRIRRNAERAGVLPHLQVEEATFSRAPSPGPGGWVVTNPPYGARLGGRRGLRPLYRALGRRLREEWPEVRVAFFSGDPVLARETRLELEEVFRTRHGGLGVSLLQRGR